MLSKPATESNIHFFINLSLHQQNTQLIFFVFLSFIDEKITALKLHYSILFHLSIAPLDFIVN